MAGLEETKAEVRASVETRDFVRRLAETMGGTAGVSAIFGPPIERDGVTVIPVARAAFGFGGGIGGEGEQVGSGGGGGGLSTPLGYIEVRDTGAEFIPIRDPRLTAVVVSAALGAAALAARACLRRRFQTPARFR